MVILMNELLSMKIIEITSCNVKGPFTCTVSVSISVTVTVEVYNCSNVPFEGQIGFRTHSVHQCKGSFTPSNSVTVTNVTLMAILPITVPVKKIKGAAHQCYSDGDGVV